ncbi:MAG: hypothetical protein AAB629_01425 [Patescibacteria group bacterium]
MKMLTHEQIPCWYELSWRDKPQTLIIRIHKVFLETLKTVPTDAPTVASLRKEFQFESFSGGFEKDFGFEGMIERHRNNSEGEFADFHIMIPRVRIATGKRCGDCNGTGEDKHITGSQCLYCDGTGKEHDYKWHEVYAISASLTVLFMILDYPEIETPSLLPQLLTVHTITANGQHGGELGGMYGIELCDWLGRFKPNTEMDEMTKAMKLAYGRMLSRRHFLADRFEATIASENGWLNVSCPGDACGLHPADQHWRAGSGYEFSSHNVDSPAQQLTLLCGLAALHDKARGEIP